MANQLTVRVPGSVAERRRTVTLATAANNPPPNAINMIGSSPEKSGRTIRNTPRNPIRIALRTDQGTDSASQTQATNGMNNGAVIFRITACASSIFAKA